MDQGGLAAGGAAGDEDVAAGADGGTAAPCEGAVLAGGTVAACGAVAACGLGAADGLVAAGGLVTAGGLLAAGGLLTAGGLVDAAALVTGGSAVMAGGCVTSGTESKVSGQLEIGSDGAGGDEPDVPWLIVEDGGQAGIVCSVGGSGGHTSVSSGIAPWAGATSQRVTSAPVARTWTSSRGSPGT